MKRAFALLAMLTVLIGAGPAAAFEIRPFDQATVAKLVATGKPVVVHVYAPWCLQCRAQEAILNRLSATGQYDDITFFRVDYDHQKDVVAQFNVPRSTLIAYRGDKEVTRQSWGTSQAWVTNILDAVH